MRASASADITLLSSAQLNQILSRGYGGAATLAGSTGGLAVGGIINVGADDATMTLPNMLISTFTQGGNYATPVFDVNGGDAIGGTRNIYARNGATLTIGATGGAGVGGGYASGSGDGGNATGGTSTLEVDASTVNLLANLGIFSGGEGGEGMQGGDASGGTSTVNIVNGSLVQSTVPGASLNLGGSAMGGNGTLHGGNATGATTTFLVDATSSVALAGGIVFNSDTRGGTSGAGSGGAAAGGTTTVNIAGSVDVGNFTTSAQAIGGSSNGGGAGGSALGQSFALNVTGADASLNAGTLSINANAEGGDGALGGTADGGTVNVVVDAGTLDLVGASSIYAHASGGEATPGGTGGSADGGTVQMTFQNGATAILASLDIGADAFGGGILGTATDTTGGSAQAGTARIVVDGSAFDMTGDLFISAEGEGGDGTNGGGEGRGGFAALEAFSGATVGLGTATNIEAEGTGGATLTGQAGGAFGGDAALYVYGGADVTANALTLNASGEGGDGQNGGFGYGGTNNEGGGGAQIAVSDIGSSLTLTGTTTLRADGVGGDAAVNGAVGSGPGGNVGIQVSDASITMETLVASANGTSGAGNSGYVSYAGAVSLLASNGSISATNATLQANGSYVGGLVDVDVVGGGSITFDTLIATANGGDGAGDVLFDVEAGSTASIGLASFSSIGDVPGQGEDGIELGIFGTLNADDLSLLSSDDILIETLAGGTLNVTDQLQLSTPGVVRLVGDGSGLIQAGILDVSAFQIENSTSLDATNLSLTTVDNLTTGDLNVLGALSLSSGGIVTAGNLQAGSDLSLQAGEVNVGTLDAGGVVYLNTGGNATFDTLTASGATFAVGGILTGGDVNVSSYLDGSAAGALSLGNITVGPNVPLSDFSVDLRSLTSIAVGDVTSDGAVGFASAGTLSTGAIDVGGMVVALGGSDISIASITTAQNETVYIADYSMLTGNGGLDPSMVVGQTPVRNAGFVTVDGAIDTGNLYAAAGTDLTLNTVSASGEIYLDAGGLLTTGALTAATAITAASVGDLTLGASTAGESISLTTGGNLNATSLDAPNIALSLAGDFDIGDLFADNSMSISAGGTLTAGYVYVGGDLALSAGLDLVALDLSAVGDISLTAGGAITAGNVIAGGGVAVTGGDVTLGIVESGAQPEGNVGGFSTMAIVPTENDVVLTAEGDLVTESITSSGNIVIDAGGAVTTGDLDASLAIEALAGADLESGNVLAGGDIALAAAGSISVLDVSGAAVSLDAGTDFTVGDVTAETSVDFLAGGLASFLGLVSSPEISVTSAQLFFGEGAALGEYGLTTLITFNAVSDELAILIGGEEPGAEGQWHLGADSDISADAIVINAVASTEGGSAPDVIIRAVEIDGSNTDGGGAQSVTVNTGGSVFVNGPVAFLNAAATDTLAINAGDSIQVDTTDGGSIAMVNGDDLSGILELTAHDIWVADSEVLSQLNANPNFNGRDAALATNNGEVNPAGALQAGEMTVTMLGSTFMVQNTGTETELAGLTVGDGGLNIINQGTDPATVVIYGRQSNSDGTVDSGDAFIEAITFGGNDQFADGSNVNGCDPSGCGPNQPPVEPGGVEVILGPIGLMEGPAALVSGEADFGDPSGTEGIEDEGGEEEGEEEEESEESKAAINTGTGLINSGPVTVDIPIEQPVTSGNDGPGF